jgi:hypothetical protein
MYFTAFLLLMVKYIYLSERLEFELRALHLQSRHSGYFGDRGLVNYLPRLASNSDPPNLSLPSI